MTRATSRRPTRMVPVAIAAAMALALAQCGQLGNVSSGLPAIEGTPQAITTSFADVSPAVELPDGATPEHFTDLDALPRGPHGGWLLESGAYQLRLRSYCLHAGTHGPSRGEGYLYAPLQGPRAAVIQSVLRESAIHFEVPQRDVQSLIWAIEVYEPIRELSPELRRAASALLTSKQIGDLNGGLLGEIPAPLTQAALDQLPPQARQIYEAQESLRRRFASASATYEELEALAVLAGPPAAGATVPRGAWSKHPGGFYVRYLPEGYQTLTLQVFVPAMPRTGARAPDGALHFASWSGASASLAANEYDPTSDVATPANTGSQRLGVSPVPADTDKCKDVSPQGTPTNPLGTGRKINIYGEGETPGFDDYATETKYQQYTKGGQTITRPLTSGPVPPGVADHTASDISMRSAPVSATTLSEIARIAKPGARFTYSAATAGFQQQAQKILDAFPNAKLLEKCKWGDGIGSAMVLQLQ